MRTVVHPIRPDLIALAVVGDGEAETGPLEGSWKGISFINPVHDGAVLPVLHVRLSEQLVTRAMRESV
jgi:phosphoketolase